MAIGRDQQSKFEMHFTITQENVIAVAIVQDLLEREAALRLGKFKVRKLSVDGAFAAPPAFHQFNYFLYKARNAQYS